MSTTPKFLSYIDRWSARPGERVQVMTSTDAERFEAQLVRLRRGGPRPRGQPDAFACDPIGAPTEHAGAVQAIHPGSCVIVPARPALDGHAELTISAWICPTAPERGDVQGIVARRGLAGGFALGLADGRLTLTVADEVGPERSFELSRPLHRGRWYFVAAAVDAAAGQVRLVQVPVRPTAAEGGAVSAQHETNPFSLGDGGELLLGACRSELVNERQRFTVGSFNGKIAAPRLFSHALEPAQLDALAAGARADRTAPAGVLAAWDLAARAGTVDVVDGGPNALHGQTWNSPLRAVTDHTWDGSVLDVRTAPSGYDAIHFHDDDLDDCRWQVSAELEIPADAPSGVYACRLAADGEEDYVPLFVRPPAGAPTARVAFLASTFTYMAYANFETSTAPVEEFTGSREVDPVDPWVSAHREVGWSMYDRHTDGSGIHYATQLRPMVTIRHHHRWWMSNCGWAFSGDMFLIDWLEAKGFAYDVVTDHDLHAEGLAALAGYDAVLTGMHPEYHSGEMLDAVERYTHAGGRLMYLGGNGFYWVTTMLPDRPHMLELRRGHAGTRTWEDAPGEDHHSSTGERGGLWRHRGRAPQGIVGVGFAAEGGGGSADYVRLPDSHDARAAFIFDGVGADEVIGSFGNNGGGAAGDEIDRADVGLGTPPDALLLATSSLRHNDYYLLAVEEVLYTLPGLGGTEHPDVRADMVYFETAGGGAVFTPGSIDWIAGLSHDDYVNNVSRITENVLRHFIGD